MFPLHHVLPPTLEPTAPDAPTPRRRTRLRGAALRAETGARLVGRSFTVLFLTAGVARFALVPIESRVARLALGPRPELRVQHLTDGRTPFIASVDASIDLIEVRGANEMQLESGIGSVPMVVVFEPRDVEWHIGNDEVTTDLGRRFLAVTPDDLIRHGARRGERATVRVEVTYRVSWQTAFGIEGQLDPVVRTAERSILVE